MKTLERKQDTREKIKHGGLVKKAGLDKFPPSVILGAMMDAVEKMAGQNGERFREEWRLKGDIAFTRDEKINNDISH